MSKKKKNTLKDLNEFLEQQAATLAQPTQLSEKLITEIETEPKQEIQETPLNEDKIVDFLHQLINKKGHSKTKLYDIIVSVLEKEAMDKPEDKMLINTALYLKHGENWKEEIRKYWRDRN